MLGVARESLILTLSTGRCSPPNAFRRARLAIISTTSFAFSYHCERNRAKQQGSGTSCRSAGTLEVASEAKSTESASSKVRLDVLDGGRHNWSLLRYFAEMNCSAAGSRMSE